MNTLTGTGPEYIGIRVRVTKTGQYGKIEDGGCATTADFLVVHADGTLGDYAYYELEALTHYEMAIEDYGSEAWRSTSSALIDLADGTPVELTDEVKKLIAVLADHAVGIAEYIDEK